MWQVIGWIIWCLLVLFAISLTFGCWKYIKTGQRLQMATCIQTLFFWIVVILFLIFEWDKVHIIWIALLAFFGAQILAIGVGFKK